MHSGHDGSAACGRRSGWTVASVCALAGYLGFMWLAFSALLARPMLPWLADLAPDATRAGLRAEMGPPAAQTSLASLPLAGPATTRGDAFTLLLGGSRPAWLDGRAAIPDLAIPDSNVSIPGRWMPTLFRPLQRTVYVGYDSGGRVTEAAVAIVPGLWLRAQPRASQLAMVWGRRDGSPAGLALSLLPVLLLLACCLVAVVTGRRAEARGSAAAAMGWGSLAYLVTVLVWPAGLLTHWVHLLLGAVGVTIGVTVAAARGHGRARDRGEPGALGPAR